jgi:hypothetical protein
LSSLPKFCAEFRKEAGELLELLKLFDRTAKMKHHLMIGTWTPPGIIITVVFDDEKLTLELVKKTDIPADEPISWMTFDVSSTDELSVQ